MGARALAFVDRLGYLRCAKCAAGAPEALRPTPDGYPVAVYEIDDVDCTCDKCTREISATP
jgi:hypothetical protein